MSLSLPTNLPVEDPRRSYAVRFLMILYIFSMAMIFAGFTSAMIVSMNDNMRNQSWQHFTMPLTFGLSTVVALASSLTFWWAYRGAKRDRLSHINWGLGATLVLGVLFLALQYIGFGELYEAGVRFVDNSARIGTNFKVNNVSGSFFMLLTGAHAAHIVAGLVVLLVQIIRALLFRINARRTQGLYLAGLFWHALTVLWIYLFIFLSVIY